MPQHLFRILMALCCCLLSVAASAQNSAQLAQQMRATGKPAMIIAGSESCVYCRQMAQELASNQEIQPLARQFLVVKVDTESKDWPVLQQAFQFQEQGIPAVFVVRADGKTIYSQAGKPRDMGGFLQRMLDDAGTIHNAETLKKLQKAVIDSQQAMKRKDYLKAVAIAEEHGLEGGYDMASLALQKLPEELSAVAAAAADRAEKSLSGRKKSVQAAIDLAELRREFEGLLKARTSIEEVWAKLAEDEPTKALLEDAVRLDRAAVHIQAKEWNEALAIYKEVAAANAGSPAAEFARRQIPTAERQAARPKP